LIYGSATDLYSTVKFFKSNGTQSSSRNPQKMSATNGISTAASELHTQASAQPIESSPVSSQTKDSHDNSTKTPAQLEYEHLQNQFNECYEISQRIFTEEQNQRQTLAFFQRRNNALLELICKVEPQPSLQVTVDTARIEKIMETSNRLLNVLTLLVDFSPETEIDKLHYVNLYLNEMVPELVNDDISSVEINPQEVDSWVQRENLPVVPPEMKQIEIPACGMAMEYVGTDGPNVEPEVVVGKAVKKKRKVEGGTKKRGGK
jgi:hypothetical protein